MHPALLTTTGIADAGLAPGPDRRRCPREPVAGTLWLIDTHTSVIVRGVCLDRSELGVRLRVPLGYGIGAEQQYELSSHLPGQSTPPGFGLTISRRATVIWSRVLPDQDGLEIGLELVSRRLARVAAGVPGELRWPAARV